MEQASFNMITYKKVFRKRILPNNQVWNYEDLDNWKNMLGLIDIDQKGAMEELQFIRGNIVTFPSLFLKDELNSSIVDIFNLYVSTKGETMKIPNKIKK